MRKSTPIQRRLMRVIMFTSGTVLLLSFIGFITYELITYKRDATRELATVGEIIAANSTGALAFYDDEVANEILQSLEARKNITAACIFDEKNRRFTYYPYSVPIAELPATPKKDGFYFNRNSIEGYLPIVQNGNRLGTLFLRSTNDAVYETIGMYAITAFAFISISFLVAYLISKRLQRSISEPILNLADKARLVSDKQDYSVRAVKYNNDELGTLTDAFNHMLTTIEKQNAAIRSFNENLEEKVQERTRQLNEQNHFIQTILDASVDLIAVFDREYNYITINRKSNEVYGMPREEIIGKNLLAVFPNLRGKEFVLNLARSFEGEFIHQEAYKSLSSDRYFENFFIPLKDNNRTNRVMVIGHDITGIMKANQQLQKMNADLERSNRDLEQFAYVASHDLQEPLRKIRVFTELAEAKIRDAAAVQPYIGKISASAKRMTELIEAVLNYSRLSKNNTGFTDVDLNSVIDHIRTDLELVIAEKKASIIHDRLPVIKGIPLQVHQLFLNLTTNALKFNENAPEIRITARLNGSARIVFEDNGIGFEQHYAEQVFSIFQRLHTNDNYQGTGIGLALCKKIVENHHGSIEVQSSPGKGTRFIITLPR